MRSWMWKCKKGFVEGDCHTALCSVRNDSLEVRCGKLDVGVQEGFCGGRLPHCAIATVPKTIRIRHCEERIDEAISPIGGEMREVGCENLRRASRSEISSL